MVFVEKKSGLNKKAVGLNYIVWLILGIIILVIGFIVIGILSGKGIGALDFIKNIFRFGS